MQVITPKGRVFYGWYVLAASFAILFVSSIAHSIIGVMIKPIIEEFGWSRSAISSAVFLNLVMYALSILVTGRLYDRFGPKWVIAGCSMFVALGYGLMATMGSLWQFFLYYGVFVAWGIGGTTMPIFATIMGNWFEKWRGATVSSAIAGHSVGLFVLIPLFSNLIYVSGWREACLLIAVLALVVNLTLAFGVIRGKPEKFGLTAYGAAERRASASTTGSTAPSHSALSRPVVHRDLSLVEAMRTPSFWLFTFVMFVCGGGDYLASTHLVPMMTDEGIAASAAATMFAGFGLLGVAGVLIAGVVADATGAKAPIVVTFAFRTILYVMLFQFKGVASFWIFSLGMGSTMLVTAPLVPMIVVTLYGIGHIGFISGFIVTVHMVGGGLWSYLGGVVYDHSGNYDFALLLGAVLAASATICALLIREERHHPPAAVSMKEPAPTGAAGRFESS